MRHALSILVLLPLVTACGKDSEAGPRPSLEELQAKAGQSIEQARQAIVRAVSEFEQSSDASLQKIDGQIAELRSKSKSASESVKADMAIALEDLEGHRNSIGEGLAELKTTTPERAKELLERMKSSLESLRKSADDTLTKFR